MTPVRWGLPAWFSGAAALALLVVGVLLVRPPRPVVILTQPETWCAGSIAGATVPEQPFPDQAVPGKDGACAAKRATAIHGGCWTALAAPPEGDDGCGTLGWEYAGKCWTPVAKARRPPQSATP